MIHLVIYKLLFGFSFDFFDSSVLDKYAHNYTISYTEIHIKNLLIPKVNTRF